MFKFSSPMVPNNENFKPFHMPNILKNYFINVLLLTEK